MYKEPMCYVQQGLVRATRQQLPAWGHPKYHAMMLKTQCHGELVEGHDTWNDSHVEKFGNFDQKS